MIINKKYNDVAGKNLYAKLIKAQVTQTKLVFVNKV